MNVRPHVCEKRESCGQSHGLLSVAMYDDALGVDTTTTRLTACLHNADAHRIDVLGLHFRGNSADTKLSAFSGGGKGETR